MLGMNNQRLMVCIIATELAQVVCKSKLFELLTLLPTLTYFDRARVSGLMTLN